MAAVGVAGYVGIAAAVAGAGVAGYTAYEAAHNKPKLPDEVKVAGTSVSSTQEALNAQNQKQQQAVGSLSDPSKRALDTAPNAPRKSLLGS